MFILKEIQEPVVIREGDTFKVVLSKYGALALDKQENLSELIGDLKGDLDLDKGILTFGEDMEFPIQVLGFYRDDLNQWSWAWDSEEIFGAELIEAAAEMRQAGIDAGIPEFSSPLIKADYDLCHTLAMATVGILDFDAHYAVNEDGLDIFVAIESGNIEEHDSVQKFRDTFYIFQKNFNIYPKIAFESYTKLKNYRYKENDDFSIAYIGEDRVFSGFTERGNVTRIQMFLGDD